MFLTFSEYEEMGGTLSLIDFKRLEFKARKEINRHTFNRIANESPARESVKMLTFELISLYDMYDNAGLSSASNDGFSESYNTITSEDMNSETENTVLQFLDGEYAEDGTPLLFRGF